MLEILSCMLKEQTFLLNEETKQPMTSIRKCSVLKLRTQSCNFFSFLAHLVLVCDLSIHYLLHMPKKKKIYTLALNLETSSFGNIISNKPKEKCPSILNIFQTISSKEQWFSKFIFRSPELLESTIHSQYYSSNKV
jgi:hypothetical protein